MLPTWPRARLPALVCVLLGLGWQLLTVHFNYGGDFTALFCTGAYLKIPPKLAGPVYVFQRSTGYDGQLYRYVAHDPLFETAIGRAIPNPAIRYRRILIPGLAYLLALGQQRWIDASYFAVNLAFLFLGTWWLAQLLTRMGLNPWFALFYLAVPAVLISLDRLVTDLAMTSLCLGFAVYVKTGERAKLYAVIALAALCRDTGSFLAIAGCAPPLFQRRFRDCLPFLAALVPAILWYGFVSVHLPRPDSFALSLLFPLLGIVNILIHPMAYSLPPGLVAPIRVFDYVELAGILLAVWLSLRDWRKATSDPLACACVLWSLSALILPRIFWEDAYAGARVYSPLMLYRFLAACCGGRIIGRVPMALVTPRILLQLVPQALRVIRGLL
jgi:hypothetical protein